MLQNTQGDFDHFAPMPRRFPKEFIAGKVYRRKIWNAVPIEVSEAGVDLTLFLPNGQAFFKIQDK
jgi:hypothetical protein